MGNQNSYLGGEEVPVSDTHPWGVNGNIRMFIPLDFANQMRKDGTTLNTEYKKFLAHRVYELVPEFLNIFVRFGEVYQEKYSQLLVQLLSKPECNIVVEKKITIARIKNYFIERLKYMYDWRKESPQSGNAQLAQMELVARTKKPTLFKYPNYLDPEIENILRSKNTKGTYTFTNNPYIMSFVMERSMKIPKVLKPKNYTTWEEYKAKREKRSRTLDTNRYITQEDIKEYVPETMQANRQLEEISARENAITILRISLYNIMGGAHAITTVFNAYSKTIFLTDSNGVDEEEAQIESFLRQNGRFLDYKVVPVMPPNVCPKAFQGISQDEFCQTWTFLITILVVLNGLDTSGDINEIVFREIIEYAKPLVGYYQEMNKKTKLGLMIIEFMFYIYKSFHEEFKIITSQMIANLSPDLSIQPTGNELEDALEEAANDLFGGQGTEDLNPEEQQKVYALAANYIIKGVSHKIKKHMEAYEYSDDVKSIVKKVTAGIQTESYTSLELVRAITRGDFQIQTMYVPKRTFSK